MTNDLLLQTMTVTKDRPVLSSERAHRQSQCDFDFDFGLEQLSSEVLKEQ
jgi:hypothetical protein